MIALVIGGAECVGEDLAAALKLFEPDRYYAVNGIGAHVEKLNVWCTLHPEHMDDWEKNRRARGLPNGYEVVAPLTSEVGQHAKAGRNISRRVSYRWPGMTSSGSSGLFAAKVAIDDGYKVVLVGVPMIREAGHFERCKPWDQRDAFTRGWEVAMPHIKDRIRSLSGWTRQILGAPTPEWLAG